MSQEIRDTINDILVDLTDEKIPYHLEVYNEGRHGWPSWEMSRVNLFIPLDYHKNKIVTDAVTHISRYVTDVGYHEDTVYPHIRVKKEKHEFGSKLHRMDLTPGKNIFAWSGDYKKYKRK